MFSAAARAAVRCWLFFARLFATYPRCRRALLHATCTRALRSAFAFPPRAATQHYACVDFCLYHRTPAFLLHRTILLHTLRVAIHTHVACGYLFTALLFYAFTARAFCILLLLYIPSRLPVALPSRAVKYAFARCLYTPPVRAPLPSSFRMDQSLGSIRMILIGWSGFYARFVVFCACLCLVMLPSLHYLLRSSRLLPFLLRPARHIPALCRLTTFSTAPTATCPMPACVTGWLHTYHRAVPFCVPFAFPGSSP